MDVKTTFLNGLLKEEVFVSQPDRFVDPSFSNHVYRLKKALYSLKQAPRAWYDKLSSFLIDHHFTKGIVDPTLCTIIHGDDILLVQIYVDEIIVGLTNLIFLNRFAKLIKDNFEMSMMGEMKFFLGLQVHKLPRGIFINQSQYTMELLRKHGMGKCDDITTPMATTIIDADLQGTPTDQTKYRSMIGGLMYLTASRLDIAFATFVCARYQARLTEKHLKEVKRIFHYLRQSINIGLWYSKDYGFDLTAYADADKLVIWSSKKQDCEDFSFWEHVEQGTIKLYFVRTEYQLADLFTKALPKERFEYLVHRIDVPAVYLQQLWKTVKKVPNTKDTISFTIDRETIIYTVDMFRDTHKMSVETLGHPFIVPSDLKFIPRFLKIVGYEGIVDKHSIKDDIPLRSVYSTGNVTVRGMLILGELLNDDICATKEYKEYEIKFVRIAEEQDNMMIVQEKLTEEDIEKIVDGDDEESYASAFADSVFQDDEDTSTMIEPKSHKENPEVVDDNDNNDDDDDDHNDHAFVRNKVSGCLEDRTEKMQTPIPSPLDPLGPTYLWIRLFLRN
ncbi:retrovirus-related pol polyprotein from transposon TNT 1-94 [Tanacetum coccineum]